MVLPGSAILICSQGTRLISEQMYPWNAKLGNFPMEIYKTKSLLLTLARTNNN